MVAENCRRSADVKVAVAAIALNEEQFVSRWAQSATDADICVIADTGSTDGTVAAARAAGVVVHQITVKPWRFDTARNTLLALIPSDIDIVINLDMDEVLVDGWRPALEAVAGTGERFSYNYVWSWTRDGRPDVTYQQDKCHTRHGWMWRHPCHETLYPATGNVGTVVPAGFAIHHLPDQTKPRSQYLELLQLAVREAPADARMAHYYARELFFNNNWQAARAEFTRHLQLPTATWVAERAESLRYIAKMDYNPERWLWLAAAEDFTRRDALVDLVDLYLGQDRFVEAAGIAARALRITSNPGDYMSNAHAYDDDYLHAVIGRVRGMNVL